MVRLSVDVLNNAYQFVNTVKQREVCFRSMQIPTLENLGVTKDQFDVVDLTDNNIRKLHNLPLLKRLETLLLHNNHVSKIDEAIGEQLPNLKTLALTNNEVAELVDINPLAAFKKLTYLTMVGNPVTHKANYRLYVIFTLKSVRVLDFQRVKDQERNVAKKLFKPKKSVVSSEKEKTFSYDTLATKVPQFIIGKTNKMKPSADDQAMEITVNENKRIVKLDQNKDMEY